MCRACFVRGGAVLANRRENGAVRKGAWGTGALALGSALGSLVLGGCQSFGGIPRDPTVQRPRPSQAIVAEPGKPTIPATAPATTPQTAPPGGTPAVPAVPAPVVAPAAPAVPAAPTPE